LTEEEVDRDELDENRAIEFEGQRWGIFWNINPPRVSTRLHPPPLLLCLLRA